MPAKKNINLMHFERGSSNSSDNIAVSNNVKYNLPPPIHNLN